MGEEQSGAWEMHLPGVDPLELSFRFRARILSLARMPAANTLAGVEQGSWGRCVLPFVPLLHGGGEPDTIQKWKELAAAEPDPQHRADYGGLAQVFATLKPWSGAWRTGLKEWNVLTSPVVDEWKAEAALAATAQANLNEARRILVRLGRKRWGDPPAAKLAALNAVTDLEYLEEMAERLLDVNTWDELLKN